MGSSHERSSTKTFSGFKSRCAMPLAIQAIFHRWKSPNDFHEYIPGLIVTVIGKMSHLTFRVVFGRCWNLGPIQKIGTWCDSFTVLLTSSNRIETSYKPVCGKQAKRNCVCEKPAAETNLHATNCLSASVRHSPLPHVNIVQSLSDLPKHIRGLQWRHQGFNIYKAQNRNDGNDGNDRNI